MWSGVLCYLDALSCRKDGKRTPRFQKRNWLSLNNHLDPLKSGDMQIIPSLCLYLNPFWTKMPHFFSTFNALSFDVINLVKIFWIPFSNAKNLLFQMPSSKLTYEVFEKSYSSFFRKRTDFFVIKKKPYFEFKNKWPEHLYHSRKCHLYLL